MNITFALLARDATVPRVFDEIDYLGAVFSASDAGFVLLGAPGQPQRFAIVAYCLPNGDEGGMAATLRAEIATADGQMIAASREIHLLLPGGGGEPAGSRPVGSFVLFRFDGVHLRDPASYRATIRAHDAFDVGGRWTDRYAFDFSFRHVAAA